MNQGLELLMKRLETHPEEFTGRHADGKMCNRKWRDTIEYYEEYLDPDEFKQFTDAFNKLYQDEFTEQVMKKLFEEEVEKPMPNPFGQAGIASGGQTFAHSMGTQQAQAQLAMQQAQMNQAQGYWNSGALASNTASGSILNTIGTSSISLCDSNQMANSISFGGETLTAKMVKKLKKLIK